MGQILFSEESLGKLCLAVPKTPVSNLVSVVKIGVNSDECLDQMASFYWDVGLYCPANLFCGFGFGTALGVYLVEQSRTKVASPIKELFHVTVGMKLKRPLNSGFMRIISFSVRLFLLKFNCSLHAFAKSIRANNLFSRNKLRAHLWSL